MGQPKDGGRLNCKRKSIKITFRKPLYISSIFTFFKISPIFPDLLCFFNMGRISMIQRHYFLSFKNFHYFFQDKHFSSWSTKSIKTSTFPKAKTIEFSYDFFIFFAIFPFPETPSLWAFSYGRSTFNIYLQKWWKSRDLEKPRSTIWASLKTGGPRTAKEMQSKSPV